MQYYFAKKYKRYAEGGGFFDNPEAVKGAVGIAQTGSGIIDDFNQPDSFGHKSVGAAAASGALAGAAAGTVFGPWGTVIGGVVGGGVGAIKAASGNKKADRMSHDYWGRLQQNQQALSQATLAQNPELAQGHPDGTFYAHGGPLARACGMYAEGGQVTPMNQDGAMDINGPSHEQGGVQLPQQDAEVEGGETMHDNFVFSKRLGFAQEDRRLEKAIGKIQSKGPQTIERTNATDRLGQRRETLKMAQEMYKHNMKNLGLPLPEETDK